jgi:elongation factor 1 alpha-like protein
LVGQESGSKGDYRWHQQDGHGESLCNAYERVTEYQVEWSQDRYDEIVEALKPFLVSAGFAASKTTYMPLAAMEGVNILENNEPLLQSWYTGSTLMNTLGELGPPLTWAKADKLQTRSKYQPDLMTRHSAYPSRTSSRGKPLLRPE